MNRNPNADYPVLHPVADDDCRHVAQDAIDSLARCRECDPDKLGLGLHIAASLALELRIRIARDIAELHLKGATWDEIGKMTGCSPDEAKARFNDPYFLPPGAWPAR